ncbi:hypothetical protein H175_107p054 (plasmid) [Bacillus thuringiensis serovar thuringiensis str. IS5056]|nr:hypothetical protein H175_107p054 [Bacillus thuringiensis serovar thuringiensis str. IS5056]
MCSKSKKTTPQKQNKFFLNSLMESLLQKINKPKMNFI